jgi:uncharacterized sulfatase
MKPTAPIFITALLLASLAVLHGADGAKPTSKPNILVIFTDDHGWADLGAQGVNADIRTPNMDQLARDGLRFPRGYVSAPQCVPSRAGMITGRYQQKFGVEDNKKGPLPLAEVTIAERLKPAGYISGQVGKWHLDGTGEEGAARGARKSFDFLPHAQGFDEYWCGSKGQYHASHDLQGRPFADAPHPVKDDRFRVVVQTEAALGFLDRRAATPEQPWFLYLAWFAPHVPLESPEPWFSQTPAHLPKERRQALAMIASMDDGLGRIRAKLKAMGAEQNTLIFFISDNGAPLTRGAWNGSLNLPLIGEKGMLTDGGIRTPFVAAWPGKIAAGGVYEHPVSSLDVAATAGALAGQPHDDHLDGVNLMPFLTGENKAAPHDTLYWRWRSQSAVLEFPWKLIRLGEKERYLFDTTTPEGETKNLLAQHPDIVARLEAKLATWAATLQPPGVPDKDNEADNTFFTTHVDKTAPATTSKRRREEATPATTPADTPGHTQGWQVRNGTLAVQGGALTITPEANSKRAPFLTRNALDLPGPLTATLRVRAKQGGPASITWRTKAESDFLPVNSAAFDWPASTEWQEVKVALPVQGHLLHLRIAPNSGSAGLEIQSLELRGPDEKAQTWRFDSDSKP